ncbi:MAG: conjugal transfer protein TraN, partial [Candidatus Aenigmatarchaeota archaeon]
DHPCPSGTFKGRGEHTTDIHCLKPELEVLNIKVPVTQEEFSDKFCNALLYYKAGPTGYKPCTNIPQTGNWTGCPDSFYVGEGRGPWSCPINPEYSCIQVTDFMSMCGIDKNCAACYPGNIEGNTYNYVEIQEIKDIPNTNPKKVTGKYANQYNYPNAKQRVTQVSGRLPYPSEVNVIQSLWGTTNFWVDDQPPIACNLSSSSPACLNDLRDVVVVWDDATKAGFYAACVYTSTGDAVCTGDAVDCVNGVCPINSALPCADWNGRKICSATKCKSAADPAAGETEIVTIDDTMYQNDGPRDENGNCLGQIYIFTGKGSRCRPPGVTVGLLNDCCESGDKVVSDSTGSAMDLYGAINAIQHLYHLGQIAYYGSQILETGEEIIEMTYNAANGYFSYTTASGTVTVIQGGISEGVANSLMDIGAAGDLASGFESYMNAFLNPTTIAITAVMHIVTKLLFGNGCDNNDVTTVMLRDSKYCHFVGDYCEKKWPIMGCVQKAKGYCCFNSKLGRIIHEQGRPQLKAFQPDGNWGEGKRPYCRGFTPEEFQMLDFSKIDLSEYFEDIQKDMDQKLQKMQETATQKVNEFYNRMSQ